MDISTLGNPTDVPDGTSPFYTEDSSSMPSARELTSIPVGAGSGLNADTIQGIQAVTATVAGPNKLVATDSTGKLPLGIIPTLSGGAPIGVVTGTYASLVASQPGAISFGIATNKGTAGMLMFYWNNVSVGDNGWTVLGGS